MLSSRNGYFVILDLFLILVIHFNNIYKILFYAYNAKNECFDFWLKKFSKGQIWILDNV
jgi:hypothetical protein